MHDKRLITPYFKLNCILGIILLEICLSNTSQFLRYTLLHIH